MPLAAESRIFSLDHEPLLLHQYWGDLVELEIEVPIEELRADAQAWEEALAAFLTPEAEEQRQAFRRGVVETIDGLAASANGERLAVVCHGGVINAYLSATLHLPGTMFFEPAYTSVSRVLWRDGDHRQLVSVNEVPHLDEPLLPSISV